MGFRFRKTKALGKGARLNIGKGTIGASLGPKGSTVSVGKRGVYGNVGIPGTGLSFRQKLDGKLDSDNSSGEVTFGQKAFGFVGMMVPLVIALRLDVSFGKAILAGIVGVFVMFFAHAWIVKKLRQGSGEEVETDE